MTGPEGAPDAPAEEPRTAPAPVPTRADRLLLAAFAVYAALLLVAAYAQLTDDRGLLDLFDFRRWFVG